MKRKLFNLLLAVSLLLFMATCVMWARSHRVEDCASRIVRGSRYSLLSSRGRLTLLGPPPIPTVSADVQSYAIRLSERLGNDDIEWKALLTNEGWGNGPYPTSIVGTGPVQPRGGSAANLLDGPLISAAAVRVLLSALERPESFIAAHVLLTRRYDAPDDTFANNKRWEWLSDDRARLVEKGAGRGPASGSYRGLKVILRLPTDPDHDPPFSGTLSLPCMASIDLTQLPTIRRQWHRRLDVSIFSISYPLLLTFCLVFVLGVTGLPLREVLLGRRRRRDQLCLACGYDLRATPHHCPECGRSTEAPS